MSRVGKKLIVLPSGVSVNLRDRAVEMTGPKGSLSLSLHPRVKVEQKDGSLAVSVVNPEIKLDRSLWGLFGSLLRNAVIGVTAGFDKRLELAGVGFKAAVKGQELTLEVGFSHPVVFKIPAGITVAVDKDGVKVSGLDKGLVGETAARIRAIRKPEPYKGTGIKYQGEVIRRKAGKAAIKAAT